MQIIPHLWYDKEALEAAKVYTSLFPGSEITRVGLVKNTPSGDCETVAFSLVGQPFMAISAGPIFKINPSISFFLNFDPSREPGAREHLESAWKILSRGGKTLMELAKYPLSELYGWVQDRWGVSWQLILSNPAGEPRPFIVPSLMFTGPLAGRAEEAVDFYASIFSGSRRGTIARYPEGMPPDKAGTLMHSDVSLGGQWVAAMDSARPHDFNFNEAVSLIVPCDNQAEIDFYWDKLAADPSQGQCGWLKDKFGVSWQVWPKVLGEMMASKDQAAVDRVTKAFLPMTKFDLAKLAKAFKG